MANLHRNNAAEWVMAIAIAPVVWMMRLFKRHRAGAPHVHAGLRAEQTVKPARKVMIEGLPPRTMN